MEDYTNSVVQGDCLEKIRALENESIDCIVTDPPYGYSFMGKDWDKAVPSVEVWTECLRVLKPGGFAFIMSAPRQDVLSQMIVRIGDAGFKTDFTSLYWTYASGFPKAMNIGKMVDKRMGIEREVIGQETKADSTYYTQSVGGKIQGKTTYDLTKATSLQAKLLDGSYGGFQPKPAVEVIIVAMKPLSEKTYIDQALKNGKGITWLDSARIPTSEKITNHSRSSEAGVSKGIYHGQKEQETHQTDGQKLGRFPANLLVSDDALVNHSRYFSLDEWANTLPFLITPKASKSEKNKGTEYMEVKQTIGGGGMNDPHLGSAYGSIKAPATNFHPTVKPLKLMSYLITLGSREGDIVLDPFCGSGTTLLASRQLNRQYIGIELNEEYAEIALQRLNNETSIITTA